MDAYVWLIVLSLTILAAYQWEKLRRTSRQVETLHTTVSDLADEVAHLNLIKIRNCKDIRLIRNALHINEVNGDGSSGAYYDKI